MTILLLGEVLASEQYSRTSMAIIDVPGSAMPIFEWRQNDHDLVLDGSMKRAITTTPSAG